MWMKPFRKENRGKVNNWNTLTKNMAAIKVITTTLYKVILRTKQHKYTSYDFLVKCLTFKNNDTQQISQTYVIHRSTWCRFIDFLSFHDLWSWHMWKHTKVRALISRIVHFDWVVVYIPSPTTHTGAAQIYEAEILRRVVATCGIKFLYLCDYLNDVSMICVR